MNDFCIGVTLTPLAYFLNKYPKISETFVHQEISEFLGSGKEIKLFSIFKPSPEEIEKIQYLDLPDVTYLMMKVKPLTIVSAHCHYLFKKPGSYLRVLGFSYRNRRERAFFRLLGNIISAAQGKEDADDSQRQELMVHFLLAPVFARVIEISALKHLHAHFADAATSFTMLIALLLNIRYSFTAHAYDVFMSQANIEQKITHASFIITCTDYNKKFWLAKYPWLSNEKIHVVYHGINWRYFKPEVRSVNEKPVIVSVARLVPKKGIAYLLKACLELKKRGIEFECRIIGDGPERARLEIFTRINQMEANIDFKGALPHNEIKAELEHASVFVLPCIIEENGNRDGIPNVIAEAMAMELPVISTRVSAIPELVEDGKQGFLLEPGDFMALADKLQYIFANSDLARSMGAAGRRRVHDHFDVTRCLKKLANIFEENIKE